MLHTILATIGPDWLWHPLGVCATTPHGQYIACRSYNFWSGLGSDLSEITLLGLAIGWWKHHNCGQSRCWRLGHAHPEHGRPVCRRHYHHDLTPKPCP